MKFFSLENKVLIWTIFVFLFFYLILRAIFLSPYCDELSTLFEYIESPQLIEQNVKDSSANNHLLNTLFGKLMYFFFGDHFFFLRLPNIVAFVLFFFSIKNLVAKSITPKYQVLVFLALNTIAWIFEYFGYLRGYGLALAFLFSAIAVFYSWIEKQSILKFAFFLLLVWLSVFANLSFFNTSLLLLFYCVFYLILNVRSFNKKSLIIYFSGVILFVLGLYPLVQYSFELKEAGALWWGNLYGLWNSTGYSLSSITLFTSHSIIKYTLTGVIIGIGIGGLIQLKKIGIKNFLSSFEGLFYVLFIGNILLIEFLAVFLKVNYPHDRAAVQLVFFLIFVFVLYLQRIKFLNYLVLILFFFPISFISNLNIYTSIYQKDHRLSDKIDNYLEKHLKAESSYSIFGLLETSKYYNLRTEKTARLFSKANDNQFHEFSFLILNSTVKPPSFYKLKLVDYNTNISIYENTKRYSKKLIKDTLIKYLNTTEDVMLFRGEKIDSCFKTNKFKVQISSSVKFLSPENTPLHLVLTLGDSINPIRHYHENLLEKIANKSKSLNMVWNSPIYTIESDKKDMSIYMWNIDKQAVIYRNLQIKIYEVEEITKKSIISTTNK